MLFTLKSANKIGQAGKEILESSKVLIKVLTKVITILLKNTLG